MTKVPPFTKAFPFIKASPLTRFTDVHRAFPRRDSLKRVLGFCSAGAKLRELPETGSRNRESYGNQEVIENYQQYSLLGVDKIHNLVKAVSRNVIVAVGSSPTPYHV